MLPRRNLLPAFLLFLVILSGGCDPKRFYEENKALGDSKWNVRNRPSFRVEITDTIARYDVYLNIRNDGTYPYSNLYLFIHTLLPGGRSATDTVECQLAGPDGKWSGSGLGNLKFNRFLFQKGMHFPRKGTYLFEIEQAMRVNELKGIRDVGMRLETQPR